MRLLRRLAVTVALAWPALADAAPAVPIVNWRYDENWTLLADPEARTGAWTERLKYIPIGPDLVLSTGLELRLRYEGYADNLWGDAAAPDDGYLWLRALPHVEARAGAARGFAQAIAGYARGVAPAPGPVDRTGIDLLQGFGDIALPFAADTTFTLRGGRQLLAYGSERLIGTRYGPNVPQPFDGARAMIARRGLRLDFLAMRPVRIGPGDFDDRTSHTRELDGAYLTLPLGAASGVDAYLLAYRNDTARFAQGLGRERRDTIGLRLFGQHGGWSWNWEAMAQRGRFGAARIRAWSLATETGYRFADAPLEPAFRLRANIASGDGDPADATLGTFNPLFPKGKYFGELSPIGPYNIANLHPAVELALGRGVDLSLAGVAYWRARRADGVYDLPGNLIRAAAGERARFIGAQGELVLGWQASDLLSFSASASAFAPGRFIRRTGPAHRIRMIGLEAMARF